MSHYAVGVVVDKRDEGLVADILAPYDENLEVEPYIEYTRKEVLEKCNEYINKYLLDPEKNKSYKGFADCKTVAELLNFYKDFWDCKLDENGNQLSTYNPKSKWDWYSVGSRFDQFYDEELDGVTNTYPFVKISDYKTVRELSKEELERYKKCWAYYTHEIELTDEEIDELGISAWIRREYTAERYETFENYIRAMSDNLPYAFVDKDGWYSMGEVGWFGCDNSTVDSENKYIDFALEYFNKPENQDKYIIFCDLHI